MQILHNSLICAGLSQPRGGPWDIPFASPIPTKLHRVHSNIAWILLSKEAVTVYAMKKKAILYSWIASVVVHAASVSRYVRIKEEE